MRIIDLEDVAWANEIDFKIFTAGNTKSHRYERKAFFVSIHDMVINPEVRECAINLYRAMKRHRANGFVDHINSNTFDVRRCNLRYTTQQQNRLNCKKKPRKRGVLPTSQYIGVSKVEYGGWRAVIFGNGKRIQRHFENEIEAAKWRDSKAIIMHGIYAKLNFEKGI